MSLNVSAGPGEPEPGPGASRPDGRGDAGVQPGGAEPGAGRGPARHRRPRRQDLRPERLEAEPGAAHRQVAGPRLHGRHRLRPRGLGSTHVAPAPPTWPRLHPRGTGSAHVASSGGPRVQQQRRRVVYLQGSSPD